MEVQFTHWNNDFYNTLQDKDQAEFFRQLGKFGLLAFTWIIIVVYQVYFQQMLLIEWRSWLTDRFLADWMKDQAYYRMQLLARAGEHAVAVDNPDQRIADDLRLFVDYTLSLSLGLLSAVVTLVTFITILWGLSGALVLWGINIPGYMVWAALIYALVGSVLTHLIGRPLIGLDFNQQRFEADFRFSLVRLRENSEGVALYRGEREELGGLRQRFDAVIGELVEDHAQAEAAHLVHLVLPPARDHLSPASWSRRASSPGRYRSAAFSRPRRLSARCKAHFPGSSPHTATSRCGRPPSTG